MSADAGHAPNVGRKIGDMRRWGMVLGLALVAACGGKVQSTSSANGGTGGVATGGSGGVPTGGFGGYGDGGVGGVPTGGFGGGDGGVGGEPTGGFGGVGGIPKLGRACAVDAECGDGLICLMAKKNGVGPAKGLCTTACSEASQCVAFGPDAACQLLGQGQYCIEGCVPGGSASVFDPKKCHGRQEVACTSLGGGQFGCLPTCNSDSDCPGGYWCNPQTGLCQISMPSGLADGAACQDQSECAGECLAQGSVMACSGRCTLGAIPQCGWEWQGDPANSFCLLVDPKNPSPGIGDAGHCVQLCNCDTDCLAATMHCAAFPSELQQLVNVLQKQGSCTADPSQPGIPCP